MGYPQQYARTDIQTSDPRAVVVLLYEGAVKFLNRASEALRRNERMAMSEQILKTQKIIQFLSTSLDFEMGGQVAENLSKLYAYMRDVLNEANLHCSVEKLDEIIGLLKTLLEAWRNVAQDPAATAALEVRAAEEAAAQRQAAAAADQPAAPDAPQAPPSPTEAAPGGPHPTPGGSQPAPGGGSTGSYDEVRLGNATPPSGDTIPSASASDQAKVDAAAVGRMAYGIPQTG